MIQITGKIQSWIERAVIRAIGSNRPFAIQLDITNLCNLRCTHCYHPHHNNQGALSLDAWCGILDQYRDLIKRLSFKPHLILCGGEPLISPMLFPLINHARSLFPQIPVSILSNGTLIDHSSALTLKQLKPMTIQISLDGANAVTHEKVRGTGTFSKTKRAVSILVSAGIKVQLLSVLSKNNASEIGEFFGLAKSWGVESMNFTRLIVNGAAEDLVREQMDRPLRPLELKAAYESILEHSARSGVNTNTSLPLMHLIHPMIGGSGRYWEGVVVDYRGDMLASSRSRILLGNLKNNSMQNIFLGSSLVKYIRDGNISGCGTCPDLRRCGGDRNAAYAATGDYLSMDPGCWSRPENITRQYSQTATQLKMERH